MRIKKRAVVTGGKEARLAQSVMGNLFAAFEFLYPMEEYVKRKQHLFLGFGKISSHWL